MPRRFRRTSANMIAATTAGERPLPPLRPLGRAAIRETPPEQAVVTEAAVEERCRRVRDQLVGRVGERIGRVLRGSVLRAFQVSRSRRWSRAGRPAARSGPAAVAGRGSAPRPGLAQAARPAIDGQPRTGAARGARRHIRRNAPLTYRAGIAAEPRQEARLLDHDPGETRSSTSGRE